MRRRTYLIVLIVVVVILVAWVSYYFFMPKYDVRQFNGNLIKVEGNRITLEGTFYDPVGKLPVKFSSARKFTFQVNNATSFAMEIIQLPSQQELIEAGGELRYKLDSRSNSRGAGSIEQLAKYFTENGVTTQNQIFVEATFDKSILRSTILRSSNPIATVVNYQILTQPLFLSE